MGWTSSILLSAVLAASVARPDLSALSSQQRQIFDRVVSEEFCSCNSSLTLSGCLELRPSCRMAGHLGKLIVSAIVGGGTADEILLLLSEQISGPMCKAPITVPTNGAVEKGPKNAPLTLIEFADFRCPHCRQASHVVRDAIRRYKNEVRFIFAPYPLQNHPLSVAAAEALMAADSQGKAWAMHDALFAAQNDDFEEATLNATAREAGLDLARFQADMRSHRFRDRVLNLKQSALDAGVLATPTFLINGRFYEPSDFVPFADRFELELDRNKGKCQ